MPPDLPRLRSELARLCERLPWRLQLMEVCGTHTVSIFRSGIRSLLPPNLRLIAGPGCPVCVTAQRHIDAALALAARSDVIIATYGDMLRVPGRHGSLERMRAAGARVHVVNSALTAVELARRTPDASVVLLGVGFETTAPATAVAVDTACRDDIRNFYVLMCHKLVVPAMQALLNAGEVRLDGFLCPGHVSVIIGAEAYRPIVDRHARPCVVCGFEPRQIMAGLVALVRQIADGRAALENAYGEAVSADGNAAARAIMQRVFVTADAAWREMGVIPSSGLELAAPYRRFDALDSFGIALGGDDDHPGCRCGDVIQGKAEPDECPLFARGCTPLSPIGPCMVSGEGTCAAWFKYNRRGVS